MALNLKQTTVKKIWYNDYLALVGSQLWDHDLRHFLPCYFILLRRYYIYTARQWFAWAKQFCVKTKQRNTIERKLHVEWSFLILELPVSVNWQGRHIQQEVSQLLYTYYSCCFRVPLHLTTIISSSLPLTPNKCQLLLIYIFGNDSGACKTKSCYAISSRDNYTYRKQRIFIFLIKTIPRYKCCFFAPYGVLIA